MRNASRSSTHINRLYPVIMRFKTGYLFLFCILKCNRNTIFENDFDNPVFLSDNDSADNFSEKVMDRLPADSFGQLIIIKIAIGILQLFYHYELRELGKIGFISTDVIARERFYLLVKLGDGAFNGCLLLEVFGF